MIISHKHKFIFIHIPRTGGTAIVKSLMNFLGDNDEIYGYTGEFEELSESNRLENIKKFGSEQGKKIWKHSTPKYIKEHVGKTKWEKYFKFCFIRNPLDIHYSWYHWLKNDSYSKNGLEGFEEAVIFAKSNSFEDFFLSDYRFSYKLTDYCADAGELDSFLESPFCDGHGIASLETEMNFIGKFERLKIDLSYLLGRLNLPNVKLKLENASRPLGDRRVALDEIVENEKARTLLNTMHKLDHAIFGYADWFDEHNEKYNNYMT